MGFPFPWESHGNGNTNMPKWEWGEYTWQWEWQWLLFHVCQNSHRSTECECNPDSVNSLWVYYNCDSSTIRVRFERDSNTIRARHATTRYEVFRALAYEIDSSTPRESVVGVSCMLIDSSMHTALTLYLYRPTLHRVCEYARNCLYKRN